MLNQSPPTKHKVVRNVPVSSDGTLRADFVAKNRIMHVTETADLRTPGDLTVSRLKDIAVAAMTLMRRSELLGVEHNDISSMRARPWQKSKQEATCKRRNTTRRKCLIFRAEVIVRLTSITFSQLFAATSRALLGSKHRRNKSAFLP
jgi:hypothetical protein